MLKLSDNRHGLKRQLSPLFQLDHELRFAPDYINSLIHHPLRIRINKLHVEIVYKSSKNEFDLGIGKARREIF
jgi:hypothetical protein